MELFVGLITVIVFLWCLNLWNMRFYIKFALKTPSNKWQTLLCCGKFLTSKEMIQTTYAYSVKYGSNCVLWMGPVPVFLSSDPQIISEILTSKNCSEKPPLIYETFTHAVGEGLFSENGSKWSRHRKLINKGFTNKVLISFLPILHEHVNGVMEEIQKKMDKGEPIDLLMMFKIFNLKNSSKTVLKRDIDLTRFDAAEMATTFHHVLQYMTDRVSSYTLKINLGRKLADILMSRKAKKHLKELKGYIHDSFQKYKAMENNISTDPSMLPDVNGVVDFLVSGSKETILNEDEILSEMTHVAAGAFETTSTALFLVLVLLAMNPECQERVYEEVNSIVPDDDTVMTIEQVEQLVYLEMVFKETIRLFPIAASIFRKVSYENFSLSNGLILPVGLHICIDIYSLHRNEDIWGPNANVFNPDNFLSCNVVTRHPFSFMPFSKGQRICVGWKYAELVNKFTLAKIIKRYKFSTDFKYEELIPEIGLSIKFAKKPRLCLERRDN